MNSIPEPESESRWTLTPKGLAWISGQDLRDRLRAARREVAALTAAYRDYTACVAVYGADDSRVAAAWQRLDHQCERVTLQDDAEAADEL